MTSQTKILINEHSIDLMEQQDWLAQSPQDGAIVTFIGKVRVFESDIQSLFLEHYQGMTEKVLHDIVKEARQRWLVNRVVIVHRIGHILTNETIVFVGVSSAHRKNAFAAVEFIMDVLKNKAPFWKKEKTSTTERWVDEKKTDLESLKKWY